MHFRVRANGTTVLKPGLSRVIVKFGIKVIVTFTLKHITLNINVNPMQLLKITYNSEV